MAGTPPGLRRPLHCESRPPAGMRAHVPLPPQKSRCAPAVGRRRASDGVSAAVATAWYQVGAKEQTFPHHGSGGRESEIRVPQPWCLVGARFPPCRRRLVGSSSWGAGEGVGEKSPSSRRFLSRHQSQDQSSTLQPWPLEPSPAEGRAWAAKLQGPAGHFLGPVVLSKDNDHGRERGASLGGDATGHRAPPMGFLSYTLHCPWQGDPTAASLPWQKGPTGHARGHGSGLPVAPPPPPR